MLSAWKHSSCFGGKSCYTLSSPGLILWDLIWDRWRRTDFSHDCSSSARLWVHRDSCLCLSPSPSLEIPIYAGWWPVGPLGVGQRLEEPHGSRSQLQPRDGSLGGGSGWPCRWSPLQGIIGVEKGNPTLPLPGEVAHPCCVWSRYKAKD